MAETLVEVSFEMNSGLTEEAVESMIREEFEWAKNVDVRVIQR